MFCRKLKGCRYLVQVMYAISGMHQRFDKYWNWQDSLMTECCSSNLCNKNNAPEPPEAKPNGKKCHCCNESGDCSGTLNCEGDEDHCVKGSVKLKENTATVKGCITRSVCSSGNASIPGLGAISCCEGNYCNGADGAGVSLLLLATMLISNLFFSN
uniref:UPAR/Ly6 domain-containing protein n=1 Tax=Neogobius melanostomus TaxID=47308 RepID=A0A8C6WHN2_9GOBI